VSVYKCCYADAESHVVLLSNDINLRNKGLVMQIDCYSRTVSFLTHSSVLFRQQPWAEDSHAAIGQSSELLLVIDPKPDSNLICQ